MQCAISGILLPKNSSGKKARNDKRCLAISLGTTRNLQLSRVKRKDTSWGRAVAMLEAPDQDNSMTFAQYAALEKKQKNLRKASAGNWSFSVYQGDRRLKHEVVGRWGLVFDFDHTTVEQIDFIRDGFADICQ